VNEPHASTATARLNEPAQPLRVVIAQLADAALPPATAVARAVPVQRSAHILTVIVRPALSLGNPLLRALLRRRLVVFQDTRQQAHATGGLTARGVTGMILNRETKHETVVKMMQTRVNEKGGARGSENQRQAPAGGERVLRADEARVRPSVGDALQHVSQKDHEHVQGEETSENDALAADGAKEAARCLEVIGQGKTSAEIWVELGTEG
jgi:hypothetical protein